MKPISAVFIVLLLVSLCLSACLPLTPVPANPVSEAYIQTAVAGTLAAERALEAGAELSFTATPEGSPSAEEGTPDADGDEGTSEAGTPDAEGVGESADPEPSLENPWMLQNWCVDHMEGCVLYDLQNRTDSWLQIELKESETGVTGFFTVRSKTLGRITMIPGHYQVKYTWWCDGKASSLSVNKAIGSWIDVFKCPQGFYQRVNKN